MTFRERLASGPLLADGAMGTLAAVRGLELNRVPALWVLESPDAVGGFHREYARAGADVLLTNTFGASRPVLDLCGYGDSVAEVNGRAVDLARGAADRTTFVAGSIGPLGYALDAKEFQAAGSASAYAEQARILADSGVDLLVLETQYRRDEFRTAIEAVASACPTLPIVACFTVGADGRTPSGDAAGDMAAIAEQLGVAVVGVNCSDGPGSVLPVVGDLAAQCRVPIWAKPNAGIPVRNGERIAYPTSDEEFARGCLALVEVGARVVGGCCGTTPSTIRALRRLISGAR